MKRWSDQIVGLALISTLLAGPVASATFETNKGGEATKDLGVTVTRECEMVVYESCKAVDSKLGTLTLKPHKGTMTVVTSTTRAHCMDGVTGEIKGGGDYETRAMVFKSNGTYGYEQFTAWCTKSDGSESKQVFTISVEK